MSRSAYHITFRASSESKWHESSDNSKHFNRELHVNFASVGIGTQQLQNFAARDYDFLLLRTREIAMYRMRDASGTLECQVVQKHR